MLVSPVRGTRSIVASPASAGGAAGVGEQVLQVRGPDASLTSPTGSCRRGLALAAGVGEGSPGGPGRADLVPFQGSAPAPEAREGESPKRVIRPTGPSV